MKGRTPQPPDLKLLKGERADRMPAAPAPAVVPAECPDWLDDVARGKWDRMAPTLGPAGSLTTIAAERLAIYCDAYSRLQMARTDLEAHGVSTFTDQGGLKTNPAVNVAKDAQALMVRVLADISRDAAPVVEPAKDKLSELLNRRKRPAPSL